MMPILHVISLIQSILIQFEINILLLLPYFVAADGLINRIPYSTSGLHTYMIQLPVFGFAITQHATVRSYAHAKY